MDDPDSISGNHRRSSWFLCRHDPTSEGSAVTGAYDSQSFGILKKNIFLNSFSTRRNEMVDGFTPCWRKLKTNGVGSWSLPRLLSSHSSSSNSAPHDLHDSPRLGHFLPGLHRHRPRYLRQRILHRLPLFSAYNAPLCRCPRGGGYSHLVSSVILLSPKIRFRPLEKPIDRSPSQHRVDQRYRVGPFPRMGTRPGTEHRDRLLASQTERNPPRRDLCRALRRDHAQIREPHVCESKAGRCKPFCAW